MDASAKLRGRLLALALAAFLFPAGCSIFVRQQIRAR